MQLKPTIFDTHSLFADTHTHSQRSVETEIGMRKLVLTFLLFSRSKNIWMETSRNELVRQQNAMHIHFYRRFFINFLECTWIGKNWINLMLVARSSSLCVFAHLIPIVPASWTVETRHGRFPHAICGWREELRIGMYDGDGDVLWMWKWLYGGFNWWYTLLLKISF